jgi:hypothetical protein
MPPVSLPNADYTRAAAARQVAVARLLGPPFRPPSIRWLFSDLPRHAAAAWRLNRRWEEALAADDVAELAEILACEVQLLELAQRARGSRAIREKAG